MQQPTEYSNELDRFTVFHDPKNKLNPSDN